MAIAFSSRILIQSDVGGLVMTANAGNAHMGIPVLSGIARMESSVSKGSVSIEPLNDY